MALAFRYWKDFGEVVAPEDAVMEMSALPGEPAGVVRVMRSREKG